MVVEAAEPIDSDSWLWSCIRSSSSELDSSGNNFGDTMSLMEDNLCYTVNKIQD